MSVEDRKIAKSVQLQNQVYGIENITIKCLEKTELINFARKLTRFENPVKNNLTLSKNILFRASLSPKITNKSLERLLPATIDSLVCGIWNISLENLGYVNGADLTLNYYLAYEEIKTFSAQECLKELLFSGGSINMDHPVSINLFTDLSKADSYQMEELKTLLVDNAYDLSIIDNPLIKDLGLYEKLYIAYRLSYPLNLHGLLKMIEDNGDEISTLPPGVQRLYELNKLIKSFKKNEKPENLLKKIFNLSPSIRKKLRMSMPPRLLLLVEGITEEMLLPTFAELLSYDFMTDGIYIMSAGGKNQVNRLYNKFKRQLRIPICLLLDADARKIYDELNQSLRKTDKLLIIDANRDLLKSPSPSSLQILVNCLTIDRDCSISQSLRVGESINSLFIALHISSFGRRSSNAKYNRRDLQYFMSIKTMSKNLAYLSGKMVPYEEILAPLSLYAYGAYTSIKYTPDGLIFLDKHLERLKYNCNELNILYPGDEKIIESIKTTLDENEARNKECIVRVTLFPESVSWANPQEIKTTPCSVLVTFREMYYLPQNYILKTVRLTRNLPHLKTTNYVTSFMAKAQAREQGAHDGLFTSKEGNICEGTAWNIFFIKEGKVYTPCDDSELLKGITREAIINICQKLEIELNKAKIPIETLGKYEAAFITNASQGPHAVMQIDNVMYSIENKTLYSIKQEYNKIPLTKLD